MLRCWRVLGSGFLVWLIPFVTSVAIFPLRQSNRGLFDSILAVMVALATGIFLARYLGTVERGFRREAALIGAAWCLMCILLDLPLFLFGGPMKMPLGTYMAEIGVGYLAIPAVAVPVGFLLNARRARTA